MLRAQARAEATTPAIEPATTAAGRFSTRSFVLATTIPTYATPTRAIWNGYTGAAGWMFRQTLEGVLGLRLSGGGIVPPPDPAPPGGLARAEITRDPARSPLPAPTHLRQGVQHIAIGPPTRPA